MAGRANEDRSAGTELDEVFGELARLDAELAAMSKTDFANRARIWSEKDRVRSRVTELQEAVPQDRGALEKELVERRRQRESLERQRLNVAAFASGGPSGSAGVVEATAIKGRMDGATGLNDVRARIARLEGILADLV